MTVRPARQQAQMAKDIEDLVRQIDLSFNYCLVDNSEIQIKLIERRNDFDLVRENLNRCVVMESIVSE